MSYSCDTSICSRLGQWCCAAALNCPAPARASAEGPQQWRSGNQRRTSIYIASRTYLLLFAERYKSNAATMSAQKTVLITGCSPGGIGYSLALTLSQAPYSFRVFATGRTQSSLEALGGKPNITPLEVDVTDAAAVAKLKETVSQATGGRLDYLINNAGRNYTVPALEVDLDEVRTTFETNVFAVMNLCSTFSPLLIAAGREAKRESTFLGSTLSLLDFLTLNLIGFAPTNPRPAIVQIGSIAAVVPYVFGSVYNASKAALHQYSDTLRLELQPFGVDVFTLVTGGVKSNIARTERRLRPDSLYHALEKEYEYRLTHSQTVGMANSTYASRAAKLMTAWKRARSAWLGGKVLLAWFGVTILPRWLLELSVRRQFGLTKLAKLENRKIR